MQPCHLLVPLLQVTFSDDIGDTEGLKSVLSPVASKAPVPSCKTPQSVCCKQRALLPQPVEVGGSQLSSSVGRGCGSSTRPRRGRRVGGTEKKEWAARRAASWKGDEERELLRAIEEEEKVEEQLDVSLELLRASEDGAEGEFGKGNGIPGSLCSTPSCTLSLLAPARGTSGSVLSHRQNPMQAGGWWRGPGTAEAGQHGAPVPQRPAQSAASRGW